MGSVNAQHTIPAPADKVWGIITDPAAFDNWLTIHAGWLSDPPAELTVGTRLVEKVVMLGMANKLEWEITEIEPQKQVSMAGTGMAGVKAGFTFAIEPAGDDTLVTISAAFSGALIVGALGKAVEKDAVKNLTESLDKLAAYAAA